MNDDTFKTFKLRFHDRDIFNLVLLVLMHDTEFFGNCDIGFADRIISFYVEAERNEFIKMIANLDIMGKLSILPGVDFDII